MLRQDIQISKNISANFNKAYEEGVYSHSPQNIALGRAGMRYSGEQKFKKDVIYRKGDTLYKLKEIRRDPGSRSVKYTFETKGPQDKGFTGEASLYYSSKDGINETLDLTIDTGKEIKKPVSMKSILDNPEAVKIIKALERIKTKPDQASKTATEILIKELKTKFDFDYA